MKLSELKAEEESVFDEKLVEETKETQPLFNTIEWSDYVMRQFEDNELQDGRPIYSGLLRVVQKLIGPVIDRKVISFSPATVENYHNATVHARVKVYLSNTNHPLHGICDYLEQDGIAEVSLRNTPAPFHLHPSATAFTKSEAQAFRKMLCLYNVVAADEVTPEDMVLETETFVPKQPISPEQINVIDLICKKLNINVMDLVNCGSKHYDIIEQVEYSTAHTMIQTLGEIQSGRRKCPIESSYVIGWRNK